MKKRIIIGVFVAAMLVLPAAGFAYSPWAKPVETVDPVLGSLVSVFRQTEPAPPIPDFLKQIYEPRKDGKTLDGGNPALARPAYPDAAKKSPPLWLVPGARGTVMLWSAPTRRGGGGAIGGQLDSEHFRKHGWVGFSGSRAGRSWKVQATILVPDSITNVRLVFKRRDGKRFARDFVPHDNVVVSNDKRFVAAIINGERFEFKTVIPKLPRK